MILNMMELFDYTFFRYVLVAALLAGVLCACVGTYVVTRRMSLVSGGIAHSSLGGVGVGAWLGFSPVAGAAVFALLSGFIIRWLSRRRGVREDSAIAMVWTFGMSVGIITSYLAPSFLPELPSFLFGNILTITFSDILVLLVLTVMTVAFFALFLPQIIAVAFDYDFAVSQHIRAGLIDAVMTALVALTVVACLKVVGIIMVIAMLSVPQVTANIFSCSFRGMVLLSALISIFNCMLGFVISYLLDVPCGASIILVSVFIYVLSKAIMGAVLALK